jgi:pimeloyl-ACP methyl ester carboxylesterase
MKMQYEVRGTGRPLVLVPGGLTGWASWESFARAYSEKRTVIRVQLLGVQFGLTDTPLPADYSVKMESAALAATLDSLGYDMPVDVVAWSYGALTSLDFALDQPNRIRSLTLIEPPAVWVLHATGKWNKEMEQMADFFQTFHGDISEDMLEGFLQYAGFLHQGQSARALPQWDYWVLFRRSLRINPFPLFHLDNIERLKKFQPPTLLIKGTGSAVWLHNIIDGLSDHIPHSRVVEFADGHAPHIVSRDKFLIELEEFQNETTK